MEPNQLPGPLKIAILTQSLPSASSARLLSMLTEQERELVSGHARQLGSVSPDLAEVIAKEFVEKLSRLKAKPGEGGQRQGGSRTGAQGKSDGAHKANGLEAILTLQSDQLFKLIKDEHPQTIAIILVHAKTAVASDIVNMLPDELKADVAMRIAQLDKVNSGMVEEINQVLQEILQQKEANETYETGGVERLAEILNQADETAGELIMGEIEEADPELAAKIKQKMFVFEDIVLVDDKGFQKLLRKVETSELAVALKAASEDVKEKVFKNLSARAGEMLREEISDMGPVRMNDVSAAQQKITGIIQDMEFKGELIISGRRGDTLIA